MHRLAKATIAVLHAVVFGLTIHAWHIVASDRFLDAYVDVGLDHGVQIAERISHIAGE